MRPGAYSIRPCLVTVIGDGEKTQDLRMSRVAAFFLLFIGHVAGLRKSWYDVYVEGMQTPSRSLVLDIVNDFNATGDGETLNTQCLIAAVSMAEKWNHEHNNKGVEIFIRGDEESGTVFLTAPFNLTSHVTLNIVENTTLMASNDTTLWPIVPPLVSYGQGRDHLGPRRAPFIGGLNLSDVVIRGGGTINGNGEVWWRRHMLGKETFTRGRLVEFLYTDGLLLEDLLLLNSPFWTVHPTYSSNVVARRLVIRNPTDSPNTDGFDPDSTVNVSLVDSYFEVGDDGVAIKSGWDCFGIDTNRPSRNIVIRNLTVNSPCCAGICIGSEMSGGVENIDISDLYLKSVGQGLRIKSGLGRGGFVRNVTYRNVDMLNTIHTAIQVNEFYGNRNPSCGDRDKNAVPIIDKIVYENIRANGTGGVDFEGLEQHAITGISMRNVTINRSGSENVFTCSNVNGTSLNVSPSPCKELLH